MPTLEERLEALESRVRSLENATGLARPTTTTEMTETEFFQLAGIDGIFLQERARMEKRSLEQQAIAEAIQKGAIAGARVMPRGKYEVTQFAA